MNEPKLTDGLDPEHIAQLGGLDDLEAQLTAYDAPEPDSAALLSRLAALHPVPTLPLPDRSWRRLFTTQVSLLNVRLWWATALVLALGVVLVMIYGSEMLVIYALLSPVLAVIGTAYLFRPETHTLHEFELFTAYSPLQILYIRLLMVLLYTTCCTLLLLLLASLHAPPIALWRLLVIWIGPMVGLTGIALYSSIRWNTYVGAALPMVIWVMMIVGGWLSIIPSQDVHIVMYSRPPISALFYSDALLTWAMAMLVVGCVFIWRISLQVAQGERE